MKKSTNSIITTRQEIGERLRKIRKERGFSTLKSLAEKLNISHQTVGSWEKGTRGIPSTKLDKVCKILDIPPSYLLGEESTTIEYSINSTNSKKKIKANKILPIGTNYIFIKIPDSGIEYLQIEKGDYAIVDTGDTKINEKFVYALIINGNIVCRKAKSFKNEIVIVSHVSKNCDISIFHKSEVNIIGKVVRIIRKF